MEQIRWKSTNTSNRFTGYNKVVIWMTTWEKGNRLVILGTSMQICESKAKVPHWPQGQGIDGCKRSIIIPNSKPSSRSRYLFRHSLSRLSTQIQVSDSGRRHPIGCLLLGLCYELCLRAKNPVPVFRVLEVDFREQEVTKEYGKKSVTKTLKCQGQSRTDCINRNWV